MKDESITNFGLLIAYVLPGFVTLFGLGEVSPAVKTWLGGGSVDSATLGGFLYVTVASVAAGLTASTFRWLVIDTLHHRTGLRPPKFDFSRLGDRVEAFDLLIEIHYRYYQFYANTLVAGAFSYVAWRISAGGFAAALAWCDLAFVVLAPVFFAGSRDTLRRYYERSGHLLAGAGGGRD